jgi:hypothetical protein
MTKVVGHCFFWPRRQGHDAVTAAVWFAVIGYRQVALRGHSGPSWRVFGLA